MVNPAQVAADFVRRGDEKPRFNTKLFQLRDIPSVMRSRLGWPVAATLMDRWFSNAAFTMPNEMKSGKGYSLTSLGAAQLDENSVRMEWALGFSRVQAAISSLTHKWASPAGRMRLKFHIQKQGLGKSQQCWKFGDLNLPPKKLEEVCQVNFLTFGQLSDPLDDFYGAMGEAQLSIAVAGTVIPKENGAISFTPEELGFYLKDAYDFNDSNIFLSQPLGYWGFNGVERSMQLRWDIPLGDVIVDEDPKVVRTYKYAVQNEDFRDWRSKNNRGGDFMVISDLHRVKITHPQPIDL